MVFPISLRPVAALLGLSLVGFGLLFLVAPRTGADLFGLPALTDPAPALIGIRQIAFGAALALLACRGDARSLAAVLLVSGIVPVVDAVVVVPREGWLRALPHLGAVPVCLFLAWRAGKAK
jgi:hypothetical protein